MNTMYDAIGCGQKENAGKMVQPVAIAHVRDTERQRVLSRNKENTKGQNARGATSALIALRTAAPVRAPAIATCTNCMSALIRMC